MQLMHVTLSVILCVRVFWSDVTLTFRNCLKLWSATVKEGLVPCLPVSIDSGRFSVTAFSHSVAVSCSVVTSIYVFSFVLCSFVPRPSDSAGLSASVTVSPLVHQLSFLYLPFSRRQLEPGSRISSCDSTAADKRALFRWSAGGRGRRAGTKVDRRRGAGRAAPPAPLGTRVPAGKRPMR